MKAKAVIGAVFCLTAGAAAAGPDKIKYPADYLKGTLFSITRPAT